MESDKKYVPISCSYYDELELWAMRQTVCEILYKNEATAISIRGKIHNLYARKAEEFMVLDSGLEIRLDQILSINGKELSKYC